ncbi:histidine kinase [Kocuria sp. cx-455]|uniref:sensor histidine kinase n=1 Tax=Kocuria sp. cx-455 TaxID=2771377 RepID=UPI001686A1E4|nr:histidine kinase [Kocuria sp. cx-455]MBD2764449.1 histidine kinase [Kocuria sp. cx-455]
MTTDTQAVQDASNENPSGWSEVVYASVWLVFLLFPISNVLSAPVSDGLKALGLTGIGLFAVLYVISWIYEVPFPRRSELVNALFWCLVLSVPVALVVPAAGLTGTYVAPFFVAVCAFRLSMKGAIIAAAVIAVIAITPWLIMYPPQQWFWPLVGISPAFMLLLVSRWVMERSMVREELQRELKLAQQRESVGRDVHDILGHSLTVVSMKVQLAKRLMATDPERAAQELDDVLVLTRDSLTDVRSTVGKLREPELSVQLVQARAALRSAGITPHLPSTVPTIAPPWRATFAWILREAVTNAVRHSAASSCWVTLTSTTLTITDDGAGLGCERRGAYAAASSVPGNGLHGMRERAERAGLKLSVTSPVEGKDRGTRIVVEPA